MNLADRIKKAEGTCIFSLGQAGYVIKNKRGMLLAVDPYLSDCVEREEGHIGFKRLLPQLIQPEDIIFDVIIATHQHLDHFDIDAMGNLLKNRHTQLFATSGCSGSVQEIGISSEQIRYVKHGDRFDVAGFSIQFIQCDHGDAVLDAVGVIIEVDEKVICETGDTCLRLDRIEEIKSCGIPDVLIGPINGAYGNMNEEEFAILSGNVLPRITIPCHYGMFASHGGDPGFFLEYMKREYPSNEVLLLCQGEMLEL